MKIEIEGNVARVHAVAGAPAQEVPLTALLDAIGASTERKPSCTVLPYEVRAWRERHDAVAIAIEYPPALRSVRWCVEDSGEGPLGFGERYEYRRLSFPFVVVLAVFRRGQLTPAHQLFYRNAPLADGEDLLMPNLLNVVPNGYGMKSWVCLLNLSIDPAATWAERVRAIGEHVFATGWNQSAERHEGDSCFRAMREIDPRVATVEAWEEASRANPSFALEVAWKPARTTLTQQLERMLDCEVPRVSIDSAEDLAGLVTVARGRERRRRGVRRWFP